MQRTLFRGCSRDNLQKRRIHGSAQGTFAIICVNLQRMVVTDDIGVSIKAHRGQYELTKRARLLEFAAG